MLKFQMSDHILNMMKKVNFYIRTLQTSPKNCHVRNIQIKLCSNFEQISVLCELCFDSRTRDED